MRRFIYPLLVGVFFLTVQTTFLALLPLQWIRPDTILILTLYLGFSYPPVSGGLIAFLMGYLTDLFSGNGFGLYALTRPLLFYGAQFFKGRFFLEGFPSQILFVFLFSLLEGLMILLLLHALQPETVGRLYPKMFTVHLPQSLFNGLIAPLLFSIFKEGSLFLFPSDRMGMMEKDRP